MINAIKHFDTRIVLAFGLSFPVTFIYGMQGLDITIPTLATTGGLFLVFTAAQWLQNAR